MEEFREFSLLTAKDHELYELRLKSKLQQRKVLVLSKKVSILLQNVRALFKKSMCTFTKSATNFTICVFNFSKQQDFYN